MLPYLAVDAAGTAVAALVTARVDRGRISDRQWWRGYGRWQWRSCQRLHWFHYLDANVFRRDSVLLKSNLNA